MSKHDGVDIAPDVVEKIEVEISKISINPNRQFKVALVKENRYMNRPICPHCNATTVAKHLNSFNENDGEFMGEICLCEFCDNIIIPLRYPIFGYSKPIFLNYTMKP